VPGSPWSITLVDATVAVIACPSEYNSSALIMLITFLLKECIKEIRFN
jgi:hypothetical protein